MLYNASTREMTIKLVYYGPALSGKTTNLQIVHRCLQDESRGRLMTLNTADDRTLFFDVLPLFFEAKGVKLKIKMFTVPGQVMHAATRKIVLAGADGVVFVADSRLSEARANVEAWKGLVENLKNNGVDPDKTPIVIQFNKRDLENIRSDEELAKLAENSAEPIFKAIALQNKGVLETLFGLLTLSFRHIDRNKTFANFNLDERTFLEKVNAQINNVVSKKVNLDDVLKQLVRG